MLDKLKRHPGLIPLSHEHREGLSFCWKLRQGLKNATPTGIMADYARWFWENHLKQHFEMEETHLIPFLDSNDDLSARILSDHNRIKSILTSNTLSRESLQQTERLLYRHIRFEEREVFPYIQRNDTKDRLNELNLAAQSVKSCDWIKPFWA
jgi:hemerythrin-like domain-containing protein